MRTLSASLPLLFACGAADPTVYAAAAPVAVERPLQGCTIQNAPANQDALALLLTTADPCPTDIHTFRALVGDSTPTMVANRGFHNPSAGSFSFFEMAGDIFFGHFTERDAHGNLALATDPAQGALLIELIVWDETKGAFNFYELIGDGTRGRWFYRGDSFDIYADNTRLHLQDTPKFGSRLRCSGCHQGGGPIMKELSAPHNDWWTKTRPLPFGGALTPPVAKIVAKLADAQKLADAVIEAQAKLPRDRTDMRQALRPLFCPEEVNLVSAGGVDDVPSQWLVDPRLATRELSASAQAYSKALIALGLQFPETTRRDGDHAWLAPEKAAADQSAVNGIDPEFVADVLAVDFTRPAFSAERCALLRLVPSEPVGWRAKFEAALPVEVQETFKKTKVEHEEAAAAFLDACAERLKTEDGVEDLLGVLVGRRAAIGKSQISKNPRGQILEPGFRVIFPVGSGNDRALDEDCR